MSSPLPHQPSNSHQQILSSTSLFGLASTTTVLIGFVRLKVVAVLLGPGGIALMGMLTTIMTTASSLAGMGLRNSGVREIAASRDNADILAQVRFALWTAHILLGILGGLSIWLARDLIAVVVFTDISRGKDVGWLGLGVFLSLIASSQTALLQGLRRVRDLAYATTAGSFLGTIAGIYAVSQYKEDGILAFVLLAPLMSVLVSSFFTLALIRPISSTPRQYNLLESWRTMLALGAVFMITASLPGLAKLSVQSLLAREIGIDASGQFQAAWAISMQYIGFVLAAMAADYYPHLAQLVSDPARANRLVNEQAEVGMLLAGPVVLAMTAAAPLVIHAIYSSDFLEAVGILRWQILGDILKVAGWPIGFVLIARAERTLFLFTQLFWSISYCMLIWLGLPLLGIEVAGIAFFISCLIGFFLNCLLVGRCNGFKYDRRNWALLISLLLAAGTIFWISTSSEILALSIGLLLSAAWGIFGAYRLLALISPEGKLSRAIKKIIGNLTRFLPFPNSN